MLQSARSHLGEKYCTSTRGRTAKEEGLRFRIWICMNSHYLGSWIWIQIQMRIWVKRWIRIRIIIKIPELLEVQNGAVEGCGGVQSENGVLGVLWISFRRFISHWWGAGFGSGSALKWKSDLDPGSAFKWKPGSEPCKEGRQYLLGSGSRILCWNGYYRY